MSLFLSLNHVLPRIPDDTFVNTINWSINTGDIWTVFGPNGSGKTLLAEVICGRYMLSEGEIQYHFFGADNQIEIEQKRKNLHQYIRVISFNAAYTLADFRSMYYQQRYNSTEVDLIPSVSDLFQSEILKSDAMSEVFAVFDINKLMNRKLVHLSSGELRKILIAKALTENPRMLIFDNPFIGLDVVSREHLNVLFAWLNQQGFQLVFLVPALRDIPPCTTHILKMESCRIKSSETNNSSSFEIKKFANQHKIRVDWQNIPSSSDSDFAETVKMKNVDVTYDQEVICSNINWTVKKGEKWALLGPNGSGKSTLLSYIFADNPQAYAKDLTLFDRRRGTGESIWDIKKRIGFTSSELHLYYRQHISCLEIIESGFFDSIGLHRNCNEEQTAIAKYVMEMLNLSSLSGKTFLKISSGEQRRVLFARALVKNPPLLILDEPFHGLDEDNRRLCSDLIDSYSSQPGKSLIFVTHLAEEMPSCISHRMELKRKA